MKADYSRVSFIETKAPRDQKCSCQCGGNIHRGDTCFARPFLTRGKVTGHSRIINLEHYDNWFENVAHAQVQTILKRRPELADYYGDNQ